jgi:hypothetical protein
MKTVSQYKVDISNLMRKSDDIDAKCIAENRDPTENERKMKTELLDTVQEYRDNIAVMERQERIKTELETPPAPLTKPKPQEPRTPEAAAKDRFPSFGAQMAAVMRAGLPGGTVDPRLNITAAASGLSETVPSDGGLA